MSKFNLRLKDNESKFEDLDKRFKTLEDSNDIRLDIRELKREVFK